MNESRPVHYSIVAELQVLHGRPVELGKNDVHRDNVGVKAIDPRTENNIKI
jgi:hypothetical protein